MSTLPKSLQADLGLSDVAALRDRRQACRELADKYKKLPDDFLRIPSSYYPESQNDTALSLATQQALGVASSANVSSSGGPLVDMIDISVVEAQLVKNYGLLRMDLYCKIRVGHMVCETQTCPNGAKNPKWDGVYQFSLKPGINSFHLEIYDEKQFSLDEKIAWLHESIPPEIFRGITVERWFSLSGKLGPQKEGSVLLVISHKRVPMRSSSFGRDILSHHRQLPHGSGPLYMVGPNQQTVIGGNPSVVPVDVPITNYMPQPPPVQPVQQPQSVSEPNTAAQPVAEVRPASEDDINQLAEMFPSIDRQIIKAVLENNNHDKEIAISALLAMG